MAMYDDETKDQYIQVEISCKNCDKHITFYLIPKSTQIIGTQLCTLKCIADYAEKQKKIKENITKQTLK